MFIPDPDFCPSRISDPGYKNSKQKRGVKKNCCPTFSCSHKYNKIENYFNFELVKKKIWANLQRIVELSTQKIWGWDPGSGVKNKPDPGSGSATLMYSIRYSTN
jgi:hypothetical protein